jgi:sigma-B regulation protein RsbQ
VVFVGHSVSAMMGVLAANQEPGRFSSLDRNYLGWSAEMAPAIMGNPERPELGAELTNSFCRTDPQIAQAFARTTFLSDNRSDLARVIVPTLILQCSRDIIAPPQVGAFVHAQIPGSTLVTLPATGHCPHLSAPQATLAAITSFAAGPR